MHLDTEKDFTTRSQELIILSHYWVFSIILQQGIKKKGCRFQQILLGKWMDQHSFTKQTQLLIIFFVCFLFQYGFNRNVNLKLNFDHECIMRINSALNNTTRCKLKQIFPLHLALCFKVKMGSSKFSIKVLLIIDLTQFFLLSRKIYKIWYIDVS